MSIILHLRCIQWFKDTNLKANHNCLGVLPESLFAVFNGSKILIWKQITTDTVPSTVYYRCIQWFKDTNLEANHNSAFPVKFFLSAVFNGSKIPICNIGIYTEQNLIVPYKSHNMLFYSSNYSIHTFLHYLLPIQVHLCHIVSNGPCLCPDSHHLQNWTCKIQRTIPIIKLRVYPQ